MRINIARRGSALWRDCVDLARERYELDYGAQIDPSPDGFIALCTEAGGGRGPVPVACAGLTYGGGRPLLIESYLDASAADTIAGMVDEPCDARDFVEVGPMASRERGAGLELIKITPALCWCNGASYLLCTATQPLVRTLERVGIPFVGITEAREEALPAEQRGRWGSYYGTSPVAGFIDLRDFDAAINRQTESGYHLRVTWAREQELTAAHGGAR